MVPWRIVVTVLSLTALGVAGLVAGVHEVAYLAAGALAGYLGKVNGAK